MMLRLIVEFLVEYQWTILFILAVIGALFYFGLCSSHEIITRIP